MNNQRKIKIKSNKKRHQNQNKPWSYETHNNCYNKWLTGNKQWNKTLTKSKNKKYRNWKRMNQDFSSTYVERMAERGDSVTVTALSLTAAEESCSLWRWKRFHFFTFWKLLVIKLLENALLKLTDEQQGLWGFTGAGEEATAAAMADGLLVSEEGENKRVREWERELKGNRTATSHACPERAF